MRTDPYEPTIAEFAMYSAVYAAWIDARAAENWEKADRLRIIVQAWDQGLGTPDTWIPQFESTEHRRYRVAMRGLR